MSAVSVSKNSDCLVCNWCWTFSFTLHSKAIGLQGSWICSPRPFSPRICRLRTVVELLSTSGRSCCTYFHGWRMISCVAVKVLNIAPWEMVHICFGESVGVGVFLRIFLVRWFGNILAAHNRGTQGVHLSFWNCFHLGESYFKCVNLGLLAFFFHAPHCLHLSVHFFDSNEWSFLPVTIFPFFNNNSCPLYKFFIPLGKSSILAVKKCNETGADDANSEENAGCTVYTESCSICGGIKNILVGGIHHRHRALHLWNWKTAGFVSLYIVMQNATQSLSRSIIC